MSFPKNAVLTAIFLTGSLVNATAQKALPEAIAAPGETAILTLHAEGAQIYECKTSADGALAWVFREPIATLFSDGKTVGRHYAGPTWEYSDGSAVVGQVARHGSRAGRNGHSLAEARSDFPARQRCAQSGDDRATDQHDGWKAQWRLLQGRRL